MNAKSLIVAPGSKVRLAEIDPASTGDVASRDEARPLIDENIERLTRLQYLLYADGRQSLLVVVQALDAGGKDGVIRRLFTGMNPQGVAVTAFKQPNNVELAHDFLWRAHLAAPAKGMVGVFNRSHYEDVLVVRVHELVPPEVWSQRFDLINDFEKTLAHGGTRVLKFFLHISPEEQLERFRDRLEDPMRRWKISDSDYTERDRWPQYAAAYEEALEKTSTAHAPWYVIPANRKWFRDLAISRIVVDTMDAMGLKLPPVKVDLNAIRARYHAEKLEEQAAGKSKRKKKSAEKAARNGAGTKHH